MSQLLLLAAVFGGYVAAVSVALFLIAVLTGRDHAERSDLPPPAAERLEP